MLISNRLLGGSALAALAFAIAVPAYAQSTGSQEVEGEAVETVVVTGQRDRSKGGLIVPEGQPKTRSTVTQAYIASQPTGQTVFQSLNLVPGLNFTNSDPYGSSGGNVRLRGFDGNRISLTLDGIPLNDTGNYAIFTNQQLDPEIVQRATVNTGTTDVDSPTASATGGTINIVARRPDSEPTARLTASVGSWDYARGFVSLDAGETDFGLSGYASFSYQTYDKFKGPGSLKKQQFNARAYQTLGDVGFVAASIHFNSNRNAFYRNLTQFTPPTTIGGARGPGQIAFYGRDFDNLRPAPAPRRSAARRRTTTSSWSRRTPRFRPRRPTTRPSFRPTTIRSTRRAARTISASASTRRTRAICACSRASISATASR